MSKQYISKKAKILAATTFLLGVFAVGGIGLVYADTSTTKTDPMTTLSTRLAQKFNLNADEVKSVVDEIMTQEHKNMEAVQKQAFADRVAKGVSAGTLTQAQADLLIAKNEELIAKRETDRTSFATISDTDRKTKMDTQKAEITAWITANNIPSEFAHFGFGGHGGSRPTESTK